MRLRSSAAVLGCLSVGALAVSALAGPASARTSPDAGLAATLTKVSSDPYQGGGAQHKTEAEPDTYAHGDTIVSVFQVGRYSDGGAVNTGWATSTDGGTTWKHGFLPGITTAEGGPWARVSDPSIAYDPKHGVWLAAGLVINSSGTGRGVAVNSSSDGIHWTKPVMAAGNQSGFYDKDWITCDTTSGSPYYGNCYVEVDLASAGDLVLMVTSTDGGKTWGAEKTTADTAFGLGGQPVVQPDGTVVVPYSADFGSQRAFRSTDGGKSWTSSVLVANVTDHSVPGMREEPLPSAEIDASGRVYVVWDDCRFRSGCSANDIVMSTSRNGVDWSTVKRIPIDSVTSGRDHFTPGIGVSHTTAGRNADIGLYYYFYPDASCSVSACRLKVGYTSSSDGGRTWSKAITLTKGMELGWLAQAGGAMVGDYISTSVIGKTAVSVFAVGKPPKGSVKRQSMYTAGPLAAKGGAITARGGVRYTGPAPRSHYYQPLS